MNEIIIYRNYSKPIQKKFRLIQIQFDKNKNDEKRILKKQLIQNHHQRGQYRSYDLKQKMEAINRVNQGQEIAIVSNKMGIPSKNIRRWIREGPYRKKGCGRKSIDLEMEKKVYDWCIDRMEITQKRVSRDQIRRQALKFMSKNMPFKASKGWTDKFVRKYNLIRNKRKSKNYENQNNKNNYI